MTKYRVFKIMTTRSEVIVGADSIDQACSLAERRPAGDWVEDVDFYEETYDAEEAVLG